jgi:4-hydroxyphenylpyruvate dioxygenase
MPVNEPTFNTPRKSQIQTFLEQNEGPGMQHMALKTDNIVHTLRSVFSRSQRLPTENHSAMQTPGN